MKTVTTLLMLGFLLTPIIANADPVNDANAGLDALNKGDYAGAIRSFTQALSSDALSPADREYAYVKRGQAYLGQHATQKAKSDFDQALKLNPKDQEAAALREQATKVENGPAQAKNGPSLTDTLNYIANALSQQGTVNFIQYTHDSFKNTDYPPVSSSSTVSNASGTADRCELTFHFILNLYGKQKTNGDFTLEFKSVDKIRTITYADAANELAARNGHPQVTAQTNPVVYVVGVESSGNGKDTNQFIFYEEDTANSVAKAMNHAAELCGAGKNNPF